LLLGCASEEILPTIKELTNSPFAFPRQYGAFLGAEVTMRSGDAKGALALCESALGSSIVGVAPAVAALIRLLRTKALHALGRQEEAHAALREATDRLRSTATSLRDPALEDGFMSNIDANADTATLERAWRAERPAP
jgi:hypothetical protein